MGSASLERDAVIKSSKSELRTPNEGRNFLWSIAANKDLRSFNLTALARHGDRRDACPAFRALAFGPRRLGSLLLSLIVGINAGSASQSHSNEQATVILVVGAPGEAEFGSNFVRQASLWRKACGESCREMTIGLETAVQSNDHDQLKQRLEAEPRESSATLWLVLLGHGTFDGKEAWFNLRGPDVSATE